MEQKNRRHERDKRIRKLRKARVRNITLNVICLLLAVGGVYWGVTKFWQYSRYEITNDAYVDQYIAPVYVRVPGYIRSVNFREHQFVSKGDTLVTIDDSEYQLKVDNARTELLDAEAARDVLNSNIETARMEINVLEASLAETKALMVQKEKEAARYKNLLEVESVSLQQYELVKADYDALRAKYSATQHQIEAAKSQLESITKSDKNALAKIAAGQTDLSMAELNLSYSVVTAPYDGYVGGRSIEVGQFVQGGQTLTNLVRSNDKWITANYKETQISSIYIGQEVLIEVDALPGKTFYGVVAEISEATGSKYALVPTDNSAGNFVKVQQRVPVRINFCDISEDDMKQLRAGMMVVVKAKKK